MNFSKNRLNKPFLFFLAVFISIAMSHGQTEMLEDREITNAVQSQLVNNSATPAYLIDVSTIDGIVTLDGDISNLLAKERAAKIAMAVKGVRGVINQIDVEAPNMQDHEIETLIKEALVEDPATEAYEIQAEVMDKRAILTGEVNSYQEKKLASHVAKGVIGVKEITNNIEVDYTITRPDHEIEEEVHQTLHNDVRIDDALIDVEVDNGEVELSGVVGSLAEKYQAETNAWVAGVKDVDSEDLEVKQWARDENLRKNKYATRSDSMIKHAVKDAFLFDPRLVAFDFEVQVDDGEVTLLGTVDNLKAKRAATADARNIVGVFAVKNFLKVRPEDIPENPDLEENISESLVRDPYVERYEIDIDAEHGVVYLKGEVDTYFDKYHAEDVASRVPGVVAIENKISVGETEDYFSYDYDTWDAFEPSPYVDVEPEPRTRKSDWEIKKDVNKELFWSPYVNEDEVDVYVANGKVVLTGTVDTNREKTYAEINALEGGAQVVENEIEVAYGPDDDQPLEEE